MGKQKINMVGGGFQHDICSCANRIPEHVEWVKGQNTAPISIHIDSGIVTIPTDKSKKNYAWLAESKTIIPNIYTWVSDNVPYMEENFELVFTNDKSLLNLSDKFKLTICSAVPWVNDRKIHKKTKLVSMITSKKVMCEEHKKRVQISDKYKDSVDLFGREYNPIDIKEKGLNDYCFSIVIENLNYSNGYSEKITDCFATGTVPIYWGSPDIGEVFNVDGMIMYDDNFDINSLSFRLYESKMESIIDNFNRSINFPIAEDYIFKTYIEGK
jgi:hypothetical protein